MSGEPGDRRDGRDARETARDARDAARDTHDTSRDARDTSRDSRESGIARLEANLSVLSDRMNAAFPNGDVDGHRRFHETQILMLEEKRRLRIAIQEKTISGLVWSALVGIALAAWAYMKDHLK